MSNRWRGEVPIVIDGEERTMRLSLGALADLEERIGSDGLVPMVERFEQGAFRSADLIILLHAGLRCGGWDGTEADVRSAHIEGGAMGAAQAAGRLLNAAFTLNQ